MRIMLELDPPTMDRLRATAIRDDRFPKQQAVYLIKQALDESYDADVQQDKEAVTLVIQESK